MGRVLLTGGAGFLGRAAVRALVDAGHEVCVAVRPGTRGERRAGISVVECDLAGPLDWAPLMKDCDAIVHIGGIAHAESSTPACLFDRVNRVATASLAAAAAQAGIRRFVFISSIAAQIGPAADHPVSEGRAPVPVNPYGRSKLAAEEVVRGTDLPYTILRPVLVYGPGAKGNMATLLRIAASPWPLPVGCLTGRRSLLCIDNFISAVLFVLSSAATINQTYVVADPGAPLPLRDIVTVLREGQGRKRRLLPVSPQILRFALRMSGRGDIWDRIGRDLWVDPSKLIAAGWRPERDTRAGLIELAGLLRQARRPA